MRLNKKTIKHTCLGCLHAIAICLPILACVFRLGYVWFNKNAKDSYNGIQKYQASVDLKKYKEGNSLTIQSFTSGQTNYYIEYQVLPTYIFATSRDIYGSNQFLSYGINVNEINFTYNNLQESFTNSFVIFSTNRNNQYAGRIAIYEGLTFEQSNSYIVKNYDSYATLYQNGVSIPSSYVYYNNLVIKDINFIGRDKYFYLTGNDLTYVNDVISKYSTNLMYVDKGLDNAFYYSTQQTLTDFHYYSENMSSDYSTYVSNLQSYFVVNVDYLSLFGVNPSSDYLYYVAINFMLNYLVTIELVLLAPEILLVFFELIRKLMFGLLDKTDERSY